MIRKAVVDDAGRMAEIHVFGWRCAYRGIIDDEILFKKLSVVSRAERFKKAIEEGEETYVYEENGLVLGFLTIGNCRDEDKPDAFELWGVYVEPLMKRSGIGAQFVSFCEDAARRCNRNEVTLWVLEKNTEARKFYEKMSYVPDGARKFMETLNAYEVRYHKFLS